MERSSSLQSKPPPSNASFGPENGDWEGFVYYGSDDEKNGVPAGMYRVGARVDHIDSDGEERECAFEEYDEYDNKLEKTVSATYLNSKRSDARTQPKYVSQYGLKQTSGKYVGLPVGGGTGRDAFLQEKGDVIVKRINAVAAVGDWEVAYRLLRYCAVAWARYPTSSMPTMGERDSAMRGYIDRVDGAIDNAVATILGHKLSVSKRREVALPGKSGGSGLSMLGSSVAAARSRQ